MALFEFGGNLGIVKSGQPLTRQMKRAIGRLQRRFGLPSEAPDRFEITRARQVGPYEMIYVYLRWGQPDA